MKKTADTESRVSFATFLASLRGTFKICLPAGTCNVTVLFIANAAPELLSVLDQSYLVQASNGSKSQVHVDFIKTLKQLVQEFQPNVCVYATREICASRVVRVSRHLAQLHAY